MDLRKVLILVGFALAGATFAAPAVGSPTVVDQYTEQIPSPSGSIPSTDVPKPTNPLQPGSGSGEAGGVGTITDPAVTEPGSDPAVVGANGGGSGGNAQAPFSNSGNSSGGAGLATPLDGQSAIESSASGSGLGAFFPLALLLIAGLVAGVAFMRRRSGPSAHPN